MYSLLFSLCQSPARIIRPLIEPHSPPHIHTHKRITALIPNNSKFIYIISESPNRVSGAKTRDFRQQCFRIIGWLNSFVKDSFPNATVVVKRGGDMFLDFARIAYSNVTICSASTFCFFASLGSRGVAHFPATKLIYPAPELTDNNSGDFTIPLPS